MFVFFNIMNRQGKYTSKYNGPPQTYFGLLVDYLSPFVKFSSVGIFIFVVILTASLFAYVAFYQAVVPDIEFNIPLNFRYATDCYLNSEAQTEARHCSFPLGNVSLLRSTGIQLLSPGQEYAFSVKLEVPESDVNYQIGNFLVSLEVFGEGNVKQYSETENVLLSYRSVLFTVLRTFILLPFLIFGYVDQRQALNIVFEKTFSESLFAPSHYLVVTLHSRFLQFYSANLTINAQLRGIKYALFAHPLISGIIIVSILMGLFGMIFVVSLCQRMYSSLSVVPPPNRSNNGLSSLSDPSSTTSSTPRSTSPSPSSFSPSRPLVFRANNALENQPPALGPGNEDRKAENALRSRSSTTTAKSNKSPAPDSWTPVTDSSAADS